MFEKFIYFLVRLSHKFDMGLKKYVQLYNLFLIEEVTFICMFTGQITHISELARK
jgi:hypothetical protein